MKGHSQQVSWNKALLKYAKLFWTAFSLKQICEAAFVSSFQSGIKTIRLLSVWGRYKQT